MDDRGHKSIGFELSPFSSAGVTQEAEVAMAMCEVRNSTSMIQWWERRWGRERESGECCVWAGGRNMGKEWS